MPALPPSQYCYMNYIKRWYGPALQGICFLVKEQKDTKQVANDMKQAM